MAFVYILQSMRDGRYYIGSTADIDQRMKHHLGGFTPSTRRFGELKLVFSQEYANLRDARDIERRLKKFKRHDYIEKIVANKNISLRA